MRYLSLLFLGTLIACSGSSSTDPSSTDDGNEIVAQWSPKASCDSGAAVLDGDVRDARHFQFVVRDRNIVDFFSSKVNHLENMKREIIVEGYGDGGEFTDDAGHFGYSRNWNSTVIKRVVARVTKDGGSRMKLTFQEITTTRSCSGYIDEVYCRNGQWSQKEDVRELANWGFQSCR